MLLEVWMELLQPKYMARIIDMGVAKGDMDVIVFTCLRMLGTTALAVVGGVGCSVFTTLAGQHFGADIRSALFRKVMSLSFAETDSFTTASLITRLTQDVNQVQQLLQMLIRMVVRHPFMGLGSIWMAFSISPRLSLILCAIVPPIVFLSTYTFRKGRPMFTEIQKRTDQLNAALQENLAGVRVIKAFGNLLHEKARFGGANDALSGQHIRTGRFMSTMFPLMMLIMNLGTLAVLYIGGWSVHNGNLSVGEVMAMINYITHILFTFMFASHMLSGLARAKASVDRIAEVLSTDSSVQDVADDGQEPLPSPAPPADVCFDHVSFRYPGASGPPVLQDISFRIRPGETVAVLGATGSGKSTLAHLLPRFYDVTEGRILLNGKDIRQIPLQRLRSQMSLVLQDSVLFSGTIEENIRWGREDASREDIAEAAAIAEAHDTISRFQDGYDTLVGQRGITLSGGQKQRVSIARALLKRPSLLIMDDSTSALDGATEARLREGLRKHCKGMSTLLIAQRISSVCAADRILVLQDGCIVSQGTHNELLQSSPVYREIVESQTGETLPPTTAMGKEA